MPFKHQYDFLKKQFYDPDSKYKLSVYFDAKQTDAASDAASFVLSCEERDIGFIIPRISEDRRLDPGELEHFRETYREMLRIGKSKGIKIAFNLEGAIEDAVINAEEDFPGDTVMRSKVLLRRDYVCYENEHVRYTLHEGNLMSLVAVSENGKPVDLRDHIVGGVLDWQIPYGNNWIIYEFLCVDDTERTYTNVLNYEASMTYLESAFSLFEDVFEGYMPDVLSFISYANLCFPSRNRRDWDPAFNEVFEARYGFDPSPYYPALFSTEIKNAEHLKALFFECRASMLVDGMVKALHDFASSHGLQTVGTVSEPKLSACSFVNGDALLCGKYSPGAKLDKAYMYGTNSIKIAAASSYNFGEDEVFCDILGDYYKISRKIINNDVLNAYARGANRISAHLPVLADESHSPEPFVKSEKAPDWQSEFAGFTSRTQALLRGGVHVSDIGLLYPIYTIHSNVNLYNAEIEGYEYPATPDNLDYMTLINSITMYSGHDLTVIHPESLNERCRVENGKLYLDNGKRTECLSVVILPCSETVSLANMRVLLEFYRSGGHLIATGELPHKAFEFSPDKSYDREVAEISAEIFGSDAVNTGIMKNYCYNQNDAGGEAYFLYFSHTAADGTNMTTSRVLNDAICSFDLPYDMYLPDMPRFEATGALNTQYFEFVRLGLVYSIPGGGMLNHIHKRHGKIDVYYFSNTTERDYDSYVLLRGALTPEEWDPHTVTIRPLEYRYVKWQGEIYTKVELKLRHEASVFIISDDEKNPPDLSGFIPELKQVRGLQ